MCALLQAAGGEFFRGPQGRSPGKRAQQQQQQQGGTGAHVTRSTAAAAAAALVPGDRHLGAPDEFIDLGEPVPSRGFQVSDRNPSSLRAPAVRAAQAKSHQHQQWQQGIAVGTEAAAKGGDRQVGQDSALLLPLPLGSFPGDLRSGGPASSVN